MSIVVGYIPNALGEAALTRGIAEAGLRGTSLVVVNATRADRLVDRNWAQGAQFEELQSRLAASGVDHEVRHFTTHETIADALLAVADEVAAELIVIGLRRRTAVGKFLLGSSAQEILLGADCPVLAVKA